MQLNAGHKNGHSGKEGRPKSDSREALDTGCKRSVNFILYVEQGYKPAMCRLNSWFLQVYGGN